MLQISASLGVLLVAGVITLLVKYYITSQKQSVKIAKLQVEKNIAPRVSASQEEEKIKEDLTKLSDTLQSTTERASILEKNIIGNFNGGYLISDIDRTCVNTKTGGDAIQLQLNVNCVKPDKYGIFTYDPTVKQLRVKSGNINKCVEAATGDKIFLNDCSKSNLAQKFDYYPLYDGRFKMTSDLSRCMGYDTDSMIINTQSCSNGNYIVTDPSLRDTHLKYTNV